MKELFTGFTEHPGTYSGDYCRYEARVPRDPDMGGSERRKVDRCNCIEKLPSMEDPQ